jgi:hypothetical protein
MPTPRRRPWGQLWAAAPWDGKARPDEPLRIPATDAALIDTPPPLGTLSLRRRSWGRLLAGAPWAARPRPTPEPTPPEPTTVAVTDSFATLPPRPDESPQPPADDRGGVDFNFEPSADCESTVRIAPPPSEVMS